MLSYNGISFKMIRRFGLGSGSTGNLIPIVKISPRPDDPPYVIRATVAMKPRQVRPLFSSFSSTNSSTWEQTIHTLCAADADDPITARCELYRITAKTQSRTLIAVSNMHRHLPETQKMLSGDHLLAKKRYPETGGRKLNGKSHGIFLEMICLATDLPGRARWVSGHDRTGHHDKWWSILAHSQSVSLWVVSHNSITRRWTPSDFSVPQTRI